MRKTLLSCCPILVISRRMGNSQGHSTPTYALDLGGDNSVYFTVLMSLMCHCLFNRTRAPARAGTGIRSIRQYLEGKTALGGINEDFAPPILDSRQTCPLEAQNPRHILADLQMHCTYLWQWRFQNVMTGRLAGATLYISHLGGQENLGK